MPNETPAAFFGHGTPMNALDTNRYTEAWRAFGASTPQPRAILMVSAHWYINASAVTAMPTPRTIHDFFGFPDELFALEYPAPGDPALAEEVVELVRPTWLGLDADSWGIDHGAWSVLVHAFPKANVPVVQLSINAMKSFDEHIALGAQLAPLCDRGVMVLASGNVVHNLGRIDWSSPEQGFDWTQRFDDAVVDVMTSDPADLPRVQAHPDFAQAVPTPDHFIPLLYLAGVAAARNETASVLVDGYAMGSLSMTSYTVGTNGWEPTDEVLDGDGAPALLDVPARETNL